MTKKHHISEVVNDYSSRLKGFIHKRVSSSDDAEDVLQDVFCQLAEVDQILRPIEHLSAWLYTVARNKITDLYRKKKTNTFSDFIAEDDEDDEVVSEIGLFLIDSATTPETEYLKSLVWIELEKALDELPQEQRIVFELNELQGLGFKEIAEMTGETVNTLISRKRYAVLHLRKRLKYLYNELINDTL